MKILRSFALPGILFLAGAFFLATGFLPWPDFLVLAERTVPILLFVVAMTIVTELADEAGVFRQLTDRIARLGVGSNGQGKVWLLWLFVVFLATVSTIFLSLDSTAVLVTPVVVLLAISAKLPPLPFALTTIWLANTASLLLPVSNLTNLLAQHQLNTTPVGFAELLWAPSIVGVLVPAAILWLGFRHDLRGTFTPAARGPVADRPLLVIAAVTVLLLLPALVTGIPVAFSAGIAAVFLLLVFAFRRRSALRANMLPWRPLLLTIGLFLVVQTLHSHGLAALLGRISGQGDSYLSLLQLTGLGALAANGVNNLPAYLALEPVAQSPVRLAALLIGVNLGPLVSPWASLATLLWHERLKALAVNVSWRGFAAAGFAAVVVVLPLAVLALWLSARLPS
ncbi:arsenic transporter [Paenarthrobacter sp. Z7-10]|uniref:SLC13 family permease n=1 Tax=Paenarthrobacter sp. Z7-10 TaxID=2787635 RepID=UPI0022A8DCDC|nr:SLC13 family permease [Paenarthrobacter sp. Z7-10]MCZ2402158.1 arsenic transporter [Paenarthrobacter sp. Z7-10]